MILSFTTNEESFEYCKLIVNEIVKGYSVTEEEAVKRMNAFWNNSVIVDEDDLIYHEMPSYLG